MIILLKPHFLVPLGDAWWALSWPRLLSHPHSSPGGAGLHLSTTTELPGPWSPHAFEILYSPDPGHKRSSEVQEGQHLPMGHTGTCKSFSEPPGYEYWGSVRGCTLVTSWPGRSHLTCRQVGQQAVDL